MVSKLKGEIAAAVSLGAGALIATGYAITAARLENVHVPAIPVLGTLPTLYYLGEAVQASVLPLLLLLTLGAAWLGFYGDGTRLAKYEKQAQDKHKPLKRFGLVRLTSSWFPLGLILTAASWLIDALTGQGGLDKAEWVYWTGLTVVLIAVSGISFGIGRLAFKAKEPPESQTTLPATAPTEPPPPTTRLAALASLLSPTPATKPPEMVARLDPEEIARDHLIRAILIVALISIIGTSTVRVWNARKLGNSLPAAVVSANPANCTFLGPTINKKHCYFRGHYFGESSQWVFLVWTPTEAQIKKLETEVRERFTSEAEGRGETRAEIIAPAGQKEIEQAQEETVARFTDQLILVPRSDVLQIAVAQETSLLP